MEQWTSPAIFPIGADFVKESEPLLKTSVFGRLFFIVAQQNNTSRQLCYNEANAFLPTNTGGNP